jgi:hypothetical protein
MVWSELRLVCEGEGGGDTADGCGSVDSRVLDAILLGVLRADIIVTPAGDQASLGSVASYLRMNGRVAARVEDRDYRPLCEAEASFGAGSRRFVWRRHEIESYLLQPQVVAEALRRIPRGRGPVSAGGPTQAEVAELLTECARLQAPREALQLTLWQLRSSVGNAYRTGLNVSPTPDGAAPFSEDACRRAAVDECQRFAAASEGAATDPRLGQAHVCAAYNRNLTAVTDAGFLEGLCFVADFDAKLLLGCLARRLHAVLGRALTRRQLENELAQALPDVYAAHAALFEPDDFLQVANGLRALGGLPPVAHPAAS